MLQKILDTTAPSSPIPTKSLWDSHYIQLLRKVRICFVVSVCATLLALGATCCAIVAGSSWYILALSIFALCSLLLTNLLLTLVLKHRLYGSSLAGDISQDIKNIEEAEKERLDELIYDLTYTQVPHLQLVYSEIMQEESEQIKKKEQRIQELMCKLNTKLTSID